MAGIRLGLKAKLLGLTNDDISELSDEECKEGSFSCCTRARTGTRAPPDRPIGRASYEGETATGLCAHTRARGDYIRELDFSKCVALYLLQGPELRASPLASPWPWHCPPTYQRSPPCADECSAQGKDRGHAAARRAPWATCNGWPNPHSPRKLVTEMRDGFREHASASLE